MALGLNTELWGKDTRNQSNCAHSLKPPGRVRLQRIGSSEMRRRKGFTLIELLVVIAIIALLMSILMPALSRVRKQAKGIICRQRLKQWGAALAVYWEDNDGYNPNSGWWQPGVDGAGYRWGPRRHPMEEPQAWLCPAATKTDAQQPFKAHIHHPLLERKGVLLYQDHPTSYSVNSHVLTECCDPPGTADYSYFSYMRGETKGADKIPVFGDGSAVGIGARHTDIPPRFRDAPVGMWTYPEEPTSPQATRRGLGIVCLDRHGCSTNWLFLDCSVRPVGLKELWRLKWHREFDTTKGPIEGAKYPAGWPGWMKKCKSFEAGK